MSLARRLIGRFTRKASARLSCWSWESTAWQNMFLFAGLVNLAAVMLAARGTLGPIGAALTHQLSTFFVMMNSLRLLRVEGAWRRRWEPVAARIRRRVEAMDPVGSVWRRRRELPKPAL